MIIKDKVLEVCIVIIVIAYTCFTYSKDTFIEDKDLIEIKAELLEKPILTESTGDNVPNIAFKIIDDNFTTYKIESCGLEKIKQKGFLNLNFRDSVIFTTTKGSTFYEKIVNEKEVFSMRLVKNNLEIISLKDYNQCKKSDWEFLLMITILLFFLIIPNFIKVNKPDRYKAILLLYFSFTPLFILLIAFFTHFVNNIHYFKQILLFLNFNTILRKE